MAHLWTRLWTTSCIIVMTASSWLASAELDQAELSRLRASAQEFILKDAQENGALFPGNQFVLGITAIILGAVTSGPDALGSDDPRVSKALAYLKSHQQEDGGIYDPKEGVGNYVTSLTLIAMANVKDMDKPVIEKAQGYLLGLQNMDADSKFFGGIGYGSKGPGHEDLNNTTYALTALRETGIAADDPALQRALAFVSRCQNLSATNDIKGAGNDGGAIYSPDVSKVKSFGSAEDEKIEKAAAANGTLKSYGSMTYNLICSFVYLNVKADDQRLKAALDWATNNYQFEKNPGMGPEQAQQGLYYYYMMMAKTFKSLGKTEITLADGSVADWRVDMLAAIKKRTQTVKLEDGKQGLYWVNEADRWAEGVPHLVTAYILSCLNYME